MNLFDTRLLQQAGPVQRWLALTILLGLVGGIVTVLQARYLSRTVDAVFLAGRPLTDVTPWLLILLALVAVRAAALWGGELAANRGAARVKIALRERLFAHLLDLGPAYARGERTGELTNTVVEGVEALDAYFREYLPQLALAALVPLTVFIFVTPLDLVSGLVLLLTAPLIPIFMILIGNLADAMTRRQWTALSRMSAHFLDVLQGLTTLKIFNRSREQIRVIAEISERHRDATMGVLRVAFLSALVLELVATLSTAVVAVEIGLRLLYGHLAFEQAFFVLILAPEFYLPLRLLGTRFHAGIAGVTAAARIFEVLEQRESESARERISEAARRRIGEPVLSGAERCSRGGVEGSAADRTGHAVCSTQYAIRSTQYAIHFTAIHHTYPDGRSALSGVTFDILPGQVVALVGPSGGGKSTVAQLLLRFIEPTGGQITVDDVTLADLPVDVWRGQIAWVPQMPYLFNASVADNIRLARPAASMAEVIEAARQAHAHDFIQALPRGYDTVIGERGARLSGGQAQRIALARAFLKDAPFVILDEATAHLDPNTEALVQASIERLLRGRTALVIAHRLHTVRRADQIVVLDGGQIVQSGTHAELLRAPGLYHELIGGDEISLVSSRQT